MSDEGRTDQMARGIMRATRRDPKLADPFCPYCGQEFVSPFLSMDAQREARARDHRPNCAYVLAVEHIKAVGVQS